MWYRTGDSWSNKFASSFDNRCDTLSRLICRHTRSIISDISILMQQDQRCRIRNWWTRQLPVSVIISAHSRALDNILPNGVPSDQNSLRSRNPLQTSFQLEILSRDNSSLSPPLGWYYMNIIKSRPLSAASTFNSLPPLSSSSFGFN